MSNNQKLICTYCKSDKITYLPDVFGQSWVRHYYEQDSKTGKFVLKAEGSTPKQNDDKADVNTINRSVINWNDSKPFFSCESCTAELDGYNDVDYAEVKQ